MTPIEAYTLVRNVEGVAPGIYHYNIEQNTLDCLYEVTPEKAGSLIDTFTVGQSFYRDASVLIVMTARFYRNFWKYSKHSKAYKVLLMDAAHLSQTLYLVCTSLNLGAFITAAINDDEIEKALRIDGVEEGVLCVSGLGCVNEGIESTVSLKVTSYVPGKNSTKLD